MTNFKNYIIYGLVATTLCGCKRQIIEQPHGALATIPITIDWGLSQLPEGYVENVSLYFYPQQGGDPYIKISGNIDSTTMPLPVGTYSVLIFNDATANIDGIYFENENSYVDFSANAVEVSDTLSRFYDVQADEQLLFEHDQLAAWRLDDFEVTSDMFQCDCYKRFGTATNTKAQITNALIDIQPTPVTAINTITVRVENLNNAMKIEGMLKGQASGANLATNLRLEDEDTTQVYLFEFQSRSYDNTDSPTDGTCQAQVTTFGKQPNANATYLLEMMVILSSGEMMSFVRDVTDQVMASQDFNIIINLTQENQQIVLPESSSGGFGVDSWGDTQQVPLL